MATRPPSTAARAPAFAEAPAWQPVAEGWRPLFGSFQELGFSFEWHDFQLDQPLDWAKSFHPGSIELCLNVAGTARLNDGQQEQQLAPPQPGILSRG